MLTVKSLISGLPGPDETSADAARNRQMNLTKPPGSLGKLEGIVTWLATWQGKHPPTLNSAQTIVFAANHGVAANGVSAYPTEVTAQMVANFKDGGAAINALTSNSLANLSVVPISLEIPTKDLTRDAAMSTSELKTALDIGASAIPDDTDILLLGEMGIGNTTSAAALACALFGGKASDWVGLGTGVNADGLKRKSQAVETALTFHKNALDDPLDALRRVGGRELAAITGATLEARRRRIPVLLDGFVSTAAASVLFAYDENALDHCLVSHLSSEAGHSRLLAKLCKSPLLDLEMRLGEASGAAVALSIVRAALMAHMEMATFSVAGVDGRSEGV